VLIPTSVWKAVYNPQTGGAGAYFAANTDDAMPQLISVAQLRDLVGIDPFPTLDEAVKDRVMALPSPTPYYGRHRH
jgi:endonuclease G